MCVVLSVVTGMASVRVKGVLVLVLVCLAVICCVVSLSRPCMETQNSTLSVHRHDFALPSPQYGRGGRYARQAGQQSQNATSENGNTNGNEKDDDKDDFSKVVGLNALFQFASERFNFRHLGIQILSEQAFTIAFSTSSTVIYFFMSRLGVGQFMSTGEMIALMWAMYDATAVFIQWSTGEDS